MPPPGFGPKLPKPSQKEAVKAAEAVNPADMYAIRMDREEESVLREVLKAAQEHSAPTAQPLMRDQRRLHQLYGLPAICRVVPSTPPVSGELGV